MQTFIFIATVISALSGIIFLYKVLSPQRKWALDQLLNTNVYVQTAVNHCSVKLAPYRPAIRLGEIGLVLVLRFLCSACITMLFLMWHLEGSISFTRFVVESGYYFITAFLIKNLVQH